MAIGGKIQGETVNQATFPVHFSVFLPPPRSVTLYMFEGMFLSRLFSFS